MRIVTLPGPVDNEDALIRQFLSCPEVVIHIRKPGLESKAMMRLVDQFTAEEKKQLVLHSCQDLSHEWGLDRVHYPSSIRDEGLDLGLHNCAYVSTSTHSWAEFNALDSRYHAAFISPVFPSISKTDYRENAQLHRTDKRMNFSTSLIALGGISKENIHSLKSDFDDVALCGAIWLVQDPFAAFETCYTLWHNH